MQEKMSSPRLTIGLPVYNGERFLSEAVDTLLSQSYGDFELLIVDNASSDRTQEICEAYAERDARVRYVRNETNIGGAANYRLAFELSHTEYFKWIADDDTHEPGYLSQCVKALDDHPEAILAHTRVRVIDAQGETIKDCDVEMPDLRSASPSRRFATLLQTPHACYDIFGVMRSKTLAKTPLIENFLASDRNLLAELGLHGQFIVLPDRLFLNRDHEGRSVKTPPHERARSWFRQASGSQLIFPYWRNWGGHLASVGRVGLSPIEKIRAYGHVLSWGIRNGRLLFGDVRIAAETRTGLRLWRRSERAESAESSKSGPVTQTKEEWKEECS